MRMKKKKKKKKKKKMMIQRVRVQFILELPVSQYL
jgi:hypothetical protein